MRKLCVRNGAHLSETRAAMHQAAFASRLNCKPLSMILLSPDLLFNPRDTMWDQGGKRLWIQTDNQQVSGIFDGSSLLRADTLRPSCVRIGRMLLALLQDGYRPRTDVTALIEWDPRELNGIADHAANCALDMRSDWELKSDSFQSFSKDQQSYLKLCVDGARRGGPREEDRHLAAWPCWLAQNLASRRIFIELALFWGVWIRRFLQRSWLWSGLWNHLSDML